MEKRAYTRVLQGVLDIADAVFPQGTLGRSIDYLGRMYLYRDGMNFGHGVGYVRVDCVRFFLLITSLQAWYWPFSGCP